MLVPVPVPEPSSADQRVGDFVPPSPDGFLTPMSTLTSATATPATNTAAGTRARAGGRAGARVGEGRAYVLKAIGPCMPAARQVRGQTCLPAYPPLRFLF